jgi:mxaL protein
LVLIAIVAPPVPVLRAGVSVVAVVDITGSMNVRDYTLSGHPISRLDVAKRALQQMVERLPCPNRMGLALFSERVPFLLFRPVDVCGNYGAVFDAIGSVDWREAWEGDSHISAGLMSAIEIARESNADLIFITDGQEAPPLPASGGTPFDGKLGEVRGLIVGAGGYQLSPIPKFDDRGNQIGFWSVDEVPHESRFGLPPPDAASRPGFEARNAPFGAVAPKGTEHLSSVREPYLRSLASQTGLTYLHLSPDVDLAEALLASAKPRVGRSLIDISWVPVLLALILLVLFYGTDVFRAPLMRAWQTL